jgi:hypothetical protein
MQGVVIGKDCLSAASAPSRGQIQQVRKGKEIRADLLLCLGVDAQALCDRGGGRGSFSGICGRSSWSALSGNPVRNRRSRPIGFRVLRAVLADVTGLSALVAGLACSVQWPAIWSCAVTRDVTLRNSQSNVLETTAGHIRVSHKHSISWLGLDNLEHNG